MPPSRFQSLIAPARCRGSQIRTARGITNLLIWANKNKRRFPWRSKVGAYRILLAEKLLQQTAARENVARAYQELTAYCPNSERLAKADIAKLTKIIKPLGFSYRAKELKALGQAIVLNYNGRVPRNLKRLLSLPGVGDYAARAVLSFAFSKDVPIVDTNVARFLFRFLGLPGALPSNPARNKELLRLAAKLVPSGRSREYNFAILDLCAAVCTSTNPKCQICPVRHGCAFGSRLLSGTSMKQTGAYSATRTAVHRSRIKSRSRTKLVSLQNTK